MNGVTTIRSCCGTGSAKHCRDQEASRMELGPLAEKANHSSTTHHHHPPPVPFGAARHYAPTARQRVRLPCWAPREPPRPVVAVWRWAQGRVARWSARVGGGGQGLVPHTANPARNPGRYRLWLRLPCPGVPSEESACCCGLDMCGSRDCAKRQCRQMTFCRLPSGGDGRRTYERHPYDRWRPGITMPPLLPLGLESSHCGRAA